MKVAVISSLESQQGRSTFIATLSAVFSRSHHKRVSIFSTQSMKDMRRIVSLKDTPSPAKSVSVFSAMLKSSSIEEKEIYDYAYRAGEEEVFLFDVFDSSIDRKELEDLFITTMKKVTTPLTLIEIIGSIDDEFNMRVVSECDAVLMLFNHSHASIAAVRRYIDTFSPSVVKRTGYICSKYDPKVISEKNLSTKVKIPQRQIMLFPYNPVLQKESLSGTLDTCGRYIIGGNPELIDLRVKLHEIMMYLFDAPNVKYIKGVNEWHR